MNKNSGKRNFVIAFPEITYPLLSISGLALHEKFLWKDKSSPKYDWKNNSFLLNTHKIWQISLEHFVKHKP